MSNINNKFEDIFSYIVFDIETLYDYFSIQFKHEKLDDVYVYECYNDYHCKILYENLKKINRPMYAYSLDFDKIMLNSLCRLIEIKKYGNIVQDLRNISEFLIKYKINYKKLVSKYWNIKNEIKCENSYIKYDTLHVLIISQLKKEYIWNSNYYKFLTEYHFILQKSPVIHNLTINSIPEILGYTAIDIKGNVKMTISLKKLQLIEQGKNIKFDFSKYTKISDIKKDQLYDMFIKYSKNDVSFLEYLFLKKPKDIIMDRWYAYQAVKEIIPNFKINYMIDLFSGSNTNLICNILEIINPNKLIQVDYTKYAKTENEKFNNYVKFVQENKHLDDKEIKKAYKEYYYNLNTASVDMLKYNEIKFGNMIATFSFGGAHGALNNYVGEDLLHLDYASLYPSIILQNKELFKNIINVDLYESVYNMRFKIKAEMKTINKNTKKYKKLDNLQNGLKLILNSTYGLINSMFNISISCRELGRFICLVGQSLLINLTNKILKHDPSSVIVNFNTDGVIIKTNKDMTKVIDEDRNGYYKLGVDKVSKVIQNDVNNYIKIIDGVVKTKGCFNLSIKQHINKHERISVNITNVLRILRNEDIQIEPIYFDVAKIMDVEDKAYYFSSENTGKMLMKNTKIKKVLEIKGEPIYFTDNKDEADLEIYIKYAKLIKELILNFNYIKTKTGKVLINQLSMF